MRIGSVEEWTKGGDEGRESFVPKCSVSIKVIPDVHCLILNKLMILSEINQSEPKDVHFHHDMNTERPATGL